MTEPPLPELARLFQVHYEGYHQLAKLTEEEERLEADVAKKEKQLAQLIELADDLSPHKASQLVEDEIIELNVGGTICQTLKSTLLRKPDSVFAQIANGTHQFPKDRHGRAFIDRNPRLFQYCLDYIRSGINPEPDDSNDWILKGFRTELEFYKLVPPMIPFVPRFNPEMKSPELWISEDGRKVSVTGREHDYLVVIGEGKIVRGTVSVTLRASFPRPNRYAIGIIKDLPQSFNVTFAYKSGVPGWGLRDYPSQGKQGIHYQDVLVAPSKSGFLSGDLITCKVDVDRGILSYQVNGSIVATYQDKSIKNGVYMAAVLYNSGSSYEILRL